MPPVPVDPNAPVGAPLYPPKDWFQKPAELQRGAKIAVITEGPQAGRVFGYVAPNKQCILSGREKQECWQVPHSPTNYAAAMQGDTLTAEGELIRTANVGGEVDHAPIAWTRFEKVRDHYANTASQVMRVVYGQDDYGVWAAGALWPEITHRQAAVVRASALSGDWRWRQELDGYDMAGSQMVSIPGFPLIPTVAARAASASDPHPAIIGGFGGIPEEQPMAPEPTVEMDLSRFTASELQRLHAILTGASPLVPAVTAGAGCACQSHTAAPEGELPMAPEAGDLAGRIEALERQVEELIGAQMAKELGEVDAMVAALPLPPDLADEERWAMPAAARSFDETKIVRHPKGKSEGGRFAPKTVAELDPMQKRQHDAGEPVTEQVDGEEVVIDVVEDGGDVTATDAELTTRNENLGNMKLGGERPPVSPEPEKWQTADELQGLLDKGQAQRRKTPGVQAPGSEARVVDTTNATLRELAAGDGRIDPMDPRIQTAAKEMGIPPGKVVEQANVLKRRQQAGTEGDFQKQLAKSESDLEDEDVLSALARGPVTPRAAQDAADKLGDAEVERIVGPGGLSGATKEQLAKLMDAALKVRS